MKIRSKLFILAACSVFILACDDTQDELSSAELKGLHVNANMSPGEVLVEVPFKAEFSVWRAMNPGEGDPCDEGYFRETMEGEGEITQLGKISTWMTFCVNQTDFSYISSENGVFVAANGDELYFGPPAGQIVPNTGDNADYYPLYFNDEFSFLGGTGRFEGATGTMMTNAFVHMDTDEDGPDKFRTDFKSEGVLILQKGH